MAKSNPNFHNLSGANIAIIMDGNGRWAKKNFLNKSLGHKAGIETAIKLCKLVSRSELVDNLTLYTFSTENWKRSIIEINQLFKLINSTYKAFKKSAINENIKIIHIGKLDKLPKSTTKIIKDAIDTTKNNTGLILNVALNYGGRAEIIEAVKKIKNTKENINEKNFHKFLFNPNLPDPDIVIRTGGDYRLSNFLLWQTAYSELFFTKTLWPDFNYIKLKYIIEKFYERKRNFGK